MNRIVDMEKSMYHLFARYYDQIFDFNPQIFEPLFKRQYRNACDIGCGTGRLTKVIHDHNINSLGIDLDRDMIEIALRKYPNIEFKVLNMLNISDLQSFDLITCFGNTIPHITPLEFNQFFKSIQEKLSDEGVFWIQLLNYNRIIEDKITELQPIIKSDFKFYRNYVFRDHYIEFHTHIETEDESKRGVTNLYPYQMHDFIKLQDTHHLQVSCYGSLDEKPFDLNKDYYLYVKVQKKGSS